jgi:hypothetical protein
MRITFYRFPRCSVRSVVQRGRGHDRNRYDDDVWSCHPKSFVARLTEVYKWANVHTCSLTSDAGLVV